MSQTVTHICYTLCHMLFMHITCISVTHVSSLSTSLPLCIIWYGARSLQTTSADYHVSQVLLRVSPRRPWQMTALWEGFQLLSSLPAPTKLAMPAGVISVVWAAAMKCQPSRPLCTSLSVTPRKIQTLAMLASHESVRTLCLLLPLQRWSF